MLLCLAITLCVVAWGFLAFAAIDFGRSARGGESASWGFLALACVGAAACLFVAMILVGRLLRATGIIATPAPDPASAQASATQSPRRGRPTSTASQAPTSQPLANTRAQQEAPAQTASQPEAGATDPLTVAWAGSGSESAAHRTTASLSGDTGDTEAGDTAEIPKVSGERYKGKRIAR